MNGRDKILAKLGGSLADRGGAGGSYDQRLSAAAKRLAAHPRGIIPDRLSNPKRSVSALFCEKVLASQASLKKVKSHNGVASAIMSYLRQHNLPNRFRMGNDKRLANLDWEEALRPQILFGPSDGNDLVCVSHALGGVAETGTLVLTSGEDNPTTLNFLPETHIVVVDLKDIVKSYEGVLKAIRRNFGKDKMPRVINMITGPSRSADIEQTLILGAHGPLRLHVILVDKGKKKA